MIHVAFEENRRAITMIWFIALLPGNLHFERTNAAQQQTNRFAAQIFDGITLYVVQNQRQPVLLGKLLQGQAQLQILAQPVLPGNVDFKGHRSALATADRIPTLVHQYAHHPGLETVRIFEPVLLHPAPEHRLLHRVKAVLLSPQYGLGHAV